MNIMKWFNHDPKPTYSVCEQCRVHFEPDSGRWGHLCETHRIPAMKRDLRKEAVLRWAEANWEKLEPRYKKEHAKIIAAYKASNGLRANFYLQQQSAHRNTALDDLYGRGFGGFNG